jgi:hypothetical protein
MTMIDKKHLLSNCHLKQPLPMETNSHEEATRVSFLPVPIALVEALFYNTVKQRFRIICFLNL